MPGLGLGHHEGVPLPVQATEAVRFGTGDVDGAFPRECLVVEVEDFVVEALQGAPRH
jgi:hypothetical protein